MTPDKAKEYLTLANVFFGELDDDESSSLDQTLNMNDVWCWACSDGEDVPDDKLVEVAELHKQYGWPGILYWVSERRNGMLSEFEDNNRFIAFVRNEEKIRKQHPDSSDRAYHKAQYTLGKLGAV